jgi:aminomethyltransferase
MGALRDYVAKDPVTEKYAVVNFPVRRDNCYRVDLEETAKLLDRLDPELVIFGKSMVLHPEPVAEMRRMLEARKKRAFIMYDMAHVLGLVGPHFQQPFNEGADIITGSTHKTFFGTQRGVVAANFERNTPGFELWKAVRRRAFPGMVSNHHLGSLVGLLLSVIEMNAFKAEYQPQVIVNAKALARALKDEGLDVQGDPCVGYTETHQVIVRVGYARASKIARRLERNNIIVNYQALPGDEGFTASSGLRLGVSEMTRFGMKEKDFREFAPLFAAVVKNGREVAEEVAKLREGFQRMQYCFEDDSVMASFRGRWLKTF